MRYFQFNCRSKRKEWLTLPLRVPTVICFFIVMLQLSVFAGSSESEGSKSDTLAGQSALENKWGIRIVGIRLSAMGYMLDFRYRVVDSEKASALFDRKTKPYLIDQGSDKKLAVPSPPQIGPLRSSNKPEDDRGYFILFGNPGGFVKSGNKVTIVIGDFRVEDLLVQ